MPKRSIIIRDNNNEHWQCACQTIRRLHPRQLQSYSPTYPQFVLRTLLQRGRQPRHLHHGVPMKRYYQQRCSQQKLFVTFVEDDEDEWVQLRHTAKILSRFIYKNIAFYSAVSSELAARSRERGKIKRSSRVNWWK